jgi:hypothetical protein
MMNKLKSQNFLLFLTFITTSLAFSQGPTTLDFASETLRMNYTLGNESEILGSPYVQEYEPVRVKGYDNQLYMARFNAFLNQMVVDLGGSNLIALDSNLEYEVLFTKSNIVYKTFFYENESGVANRGFLAIIGGNENYSLLREESVKYYDMVPAVTSYQADKPAKYVRESDNYYLKIGDKISPLPSKKKNLLKRYPEHSKVIKAFLKENKISLKEEADLKKLAEFIATL